MPDTHRFLPWAVTSVVMGAMLVAAALAWPSSRVASSASAPGFDPAVTGIVSPSEGQLVRGGRVSVVIRSHTSLRSMRVLLDGRSIGGRFRPAGAGTYRAVLQRGRALHDGENLLTVRSVTGDRFDFDYVPFVVARPGRRLFAVRELRVGAGDVPVRVVVGLARDVVFRARVNGRRVDGAFLAERGKLVGRLGANDGLRQGSNRIDLVAFRSSGRRASYAVFSRRFRLGRDSPIAAAGPDQVATQNQLVRFDGTGSRLGRGGTRSRELIWRISAAPRGSRARLIDAKTEHPGLTADRPGTYRIRLTFAAARGAQAPRSGARSAVAQSAAASNDTVTLATRPDAPYGVPLQSSANGGAIVLNGQTLPGTGGRTSSQVSFALLNRTTLQREDSGKVGLNPTGLDSLASSARGNSDGNHLMIFNFNGNPEARAQLDQVFRLVGGSGLPADDPFAKRLPGSVIGIPGAAPGVAFLNHRDVPDKPAPDGGNMSGILRLNPALFDFVFNDYVHVDTSARQTDTESTIVVGGTSYTKTHAARTSGFEYLRLDAKTLAPQANFIHTTNSGDPAHDAAEVKRLADDLTFATTAPDHPLLILQSFGQPSGYGEDWDRAAMAIAKLGGTRQVFNALNQPGGGVDPDTGRRGAYALIARVGQGAPRAEASYPLTGKPGRLEGLLMRSRTADFEPTTVSYARADGSSPVNEELVRIVTSSPSTPFPPLASKAAEEFLGREVMRVCQAGAPCDVRKTYYTNYDSPSWPTIATELNSDSARNKCQGPQPGFTPAECDKVRLQLFDEVQAANRVRSYFGPLGLQRPFGSAAAPGLANVAAVSDEIQRAVRPDPVSNTTSNALTLTSYVLSLGSFIPPPAGAVFGTVAAGFSLAGYLTNKENAPNLIGPEVQTQASRLGVELTDRYRTAGRQFDQFGRIIVSDYGKLTAVAGKVDSDPNWILGDVTAATDTLELGAKQTIYERLFPLAWPVLYDLGASGNARNWYCSGGPFLFDKHLFADEPDTAQTVQRFERTNWNPVIAAAAPHATGSLHSARIPGPPADLADRLFRAPGGGGIGLYKLEFYSPRLGFRYFPPEPARDAARRARNGDWNTLYPGIDPRFPSRRNINPIACSNIPNPPGNSG